jgi:NAD+ synthase
MNCEAVTDRIVQFVEDKVAAAGAKGVVLGMSGGVDSTVMAFLLGKSNLRAMGVVLPCASDEDDEEYAYDGLAWCQDELHFDLTAMHGLFTQLLEIYENRIIPEDADRDRLALANLKARLRMSVLYYFANRENLLVCGTTNTSEALLGYYTKYGDGGVDIEPLADLYKTEVYELAEYLEVMEEIIDKPPSAGLWKGQTDEEELGLTYAEMDPMLRCISSALAVHADLDAYAADLKRETPSDGRVLDIIVPIVKASQHKREMPPGCSLRRVK